MEKVIKLESSAKAASLTDALMDAYKNADKMNLAEVYTALSAFVFGVSKSVLDSSFAKERSNAEMSEKVMELAIAYSAIGAWTAAKTTHPSEDIVFAEIRSLEDKNFSVVKIF